MTRLADRKHAAVVVDHDKAGRRAQTGQAAASNSAMLRAGGQDAGAFVLLVPPQAAPHHVLRTRQDGRVGYDSQRAGCPAHGHIDVGAPHRVGVEHHGMVRFEAFQQ